MLLFIALHKSLLAQNHAFTTGKWEPEGTRTSWWGAAVSPDVEITRKDPFLLIQGMCNEICFFHKYLKRKAMLPFSSYEVGEPSWELLNLRFLPAKSPVSVFGLPAFENELFLWKA